MIDDTTQIAERIAAGGPDALATILRPPLERQAANRSVSLGPAQLDRLTAESVRRADGVLWRRALAGVGAAELGIGLGEAIFHPAVEQAHVLVGAPEYVPAEGRPAGLPPAPAPTLAPSPTISPPTIPPPTIPPPTIPPTTMPPPPAIPAAEPLESKAAEDLQTPQAVRVLAVHLAGIETVRVGERDLELRFSDAGIDVLVRSSGASIGRLAWDEIASIEIAPMRRGLRARRGSQELTLRTDLGQARFELPRLAEADLRAQLAPYLGRTREGR